MAMVRASGIGGFGVVAGAVLESPGDGVGAVVGVLVLGGGDGNGAAGVPVGVGEVEEGGLQGDGGVGVGQGDADARHGGHGSQADEEGLLSAFDDLQEGGQHDEGAGLVVIVDGDAFVHIRCHDATGGGEGDVDPFVGDIDVVGGGDADRLCV